jgi:hypothetical protein
MKKKITSISLIFLFFVSTVGLPLSVNLCSMMKSEEVELCEMHSNNMSCENEESSTSGKIALKKQDCCKTEIIYKSISDQYLKVDSQNQNSNQIIVLNNPDLSDDYFSKINSSNYFNDSSPSALLNNNIYLNNSVLLI